MTSKRIILISFCIIAILVLGSLIGTILYYYHHPSAVKTLLERSLSRATGTSLTVKALSYSIKPLSIQAKGIIIEAGESQHGFHIEIPNLKTDMALVGRFGHKSLSFTNFKIVGFSARLSREMTLPGISSKGDTPPPLLIRFWERMIRLFLFRGVTLEAAEAVDGDIEFQSCDQIIDVSGIQARLSPEHGVDISCNVQAEWPEEKVRLVIPRLHITTDHAAALVDSEIKGLLNAQGATFQSPNADIREMKLASTLVYDHNHEKLAFDPVDLRCEGITLKFIPFSLSGPVDLRGNIDGVNEQQVRQWRGDIEAQLSNNPCSYVTEQIRLTGKVTGNLRAEGPFPDMDLFVSLTGDEIALSGQGVTVKPFKASLSVSGKHPLHHIEEIHVAMPQATLAMGSRDVRIDDIQIRVREGSVNAEKGSVSLPEVQLTSSLFKNLRLSLSVHEKEVMAELQGEDIHLLESALALGLVPSGWEFSGLDFLKVRAVLNEKDRCSLTSRFGFKDFVFQDNDGSHMGEGIVVEAASEAEIDLKRSDVTVNTTFKADGGEILWDRFYLNLSENPFSASLKGMYGIRKQSLQLSEVKLSLEDILDLDLHGTILHQAQNASVDLVAKIEETALSPIFHHFVSEPFRAEKPSLSSMQTKGSIAAAVRLTGKQSDWTAKGNFSWREGALSSGDDGFSLQGIELELPLWYQTRKDTVAQETEKGRLSIQSMILPLFPEQPLNFPLDVAPNRLFVRSPTSLKVPGGNVKVGPVACENIFGEKASMRTSLEVNDLQMNELLSGIWSSPIQGRINGKLDPIHFEGDTLTSEGGEIEASTFDGQLILSGIGASNLSTSGPVFRVDAKWNDLSLAALTTGTSFGRIDGVLQGYVKGLQIAYGQPQAFDLVLETVKTKGVPQKISVKAVDNIAKIGGGQSPFMGLAGGFTSLFKEFPYEKIGVHASLENDVFRINGTIKERGTEYLVKRSRFSGVNVVNQDPDNRVRFKDMVKRIKRVTDSKSGPVVK